MPAFSIGVDLGGTNLRIAAVEESGTQLEGVSVLTEISRGREKVVDEIMVSKIFGVAGARVVI